MNVVAVALLALTVAADDAGTWRLASLDTGGEEVTWSIDGGNVGRTGDGQPAHIQLPAGNHTFHAASNATTAWRIMARPMPDAGDALVVGPAWSATWHPNQTVQARVAAAASPGDGAVPDAPRADGAGGPRFGAAAAVPLVGAAVAAAWLAARRDPPDESTGSKQP